MEPSLEERVSLLESENAALRQRVDESEATIVGVLTRDRKRIETFHNLEKLAIGLVSFVVVLAVSGFNIRGSIGDSSYEFDVSIDDFVKLGTAVTTGGVATLATAIATRKRDDEDILK